MRLYLINPSNPLVSISNIKTSRWNHFRVWKPLSLMVLAGLTPPEWEISIIDENLGMPDYQTMPKPDLVGITSFTSQANRAYEISKHYRRMGVKVIMGGIHTTLCQDEVRQYVDCVVSGEAEGIWGQVLEDFQKGCLKDKYEGKMADMNEIVFARHDLTSQGYAFGAIQTTRGCPLKCNFCSVSAFNGTHYRQRNIEEVVEEFLSIPEKLVLIVDDNLIGTRAEHIARAKDLFRAMKQANLKKKWVAQVSINFADDDELIELAAKAGCRGVFIGFETPSAEGLKELGKKFNLMKQRNYRTSVKRIQRHQIMVVGSFIIGLDIDEKGVGKNIAKVAHHYGVDSLNVLFLTPLPGTGLWDKMKMENRIILDSYPADWKFYTLTYPVSHCKHLSMEDLLKEMLVCEREFYNLPRIARRVWSNFWHRRELLISLVGNLSYRRNHQLNIGLYEDFEASVIERFRLKETHLNN